MTGPSTTSALVRAWADVLGEHDRLGSPLRRFLRPTGSLADVGPQLIAYGATPLLSLEWWHQHVGGVDQAAYEAVRGQRVALGLFPGGYPLTLAEAADTRVEFREQAERLAQWSDGRWSPDECWKTTWWPIISAEPATIAVDADDSVVRIEWNAERGPVVDTLCPSVAAFLSAIAEAFRSNTYVWSDGAGLLQMRNGSAPPSPPSCR